MNEEGKILITFDIDGTLIKFGGESRKHPEAFISAFNKFCGLNIDVFPEDFLGVKTDGWTDSHLISALLAKANFSTDSDTLKRVQALAEAEYFAIVGPNFNLVPNAVEFLASLTRIPNVTMSIASGNFESIAWKKLELAGLSSFFQRENGGGFGELHDRTELLQQAESCCKGPFTHKIHIGDTIADAEAAHACGFTSVIVTTGRRKEGFPEYSHVFPTLPEDAATLLSAVLNN